LPEANPIMPVYRQRLAELRQMRANLAATSAAAVIPQAPPSGRDSGGGTIR
jgi:hypothetical protein